jgi:Flp pilus assembly protein TadG
MHWRRLRTVGPLPSLVARRVRDSCRSVRGDRHGMSVLELAIIGPILVVAVVAVVELGNAAQQQILLQQALRAGGQYAMSFPTDTNGIQSAVTNALPSNWNNVTVGTPTASCTCWSSSLTSNCVASGPPCTSSQTVERFMALTASSVYTGTFIHTTISSSYVARYQ